MSDTKSLSGDVQQQLIDESEDASSNPTGNATIGDLIAERLSRRDLIKGAGALASTVIAAASLPADAAMRGAKQHRNSTPSFSFQELPAGIGENHFVAEGHDADILIRWGDKVLGTAPQFDPYQQSGSNQAQQFGYNNDFVGYVPIDGKSDHGLLVINHEFTTDWLMFPARGGMKHRERMATLTAEQVATEMMAHGGSVIEVRRDDNGKWLVVENSRYARRITAQTEMDISGPAAGHPLMQTRADPTGRRVHGMVNNCAGATTPWGTWLTCEENFNGYFWGKAARAKHPQAKALKRYGAPGQWFGWGRYHDRFDISKEPNEVHRFGWVVEIDPFDPEARPVKRTALGRFKHEGAGNIINKDGRFVVYQGDDQRFDYVYKFVTAGTVNQADRKANFGLLGQRRALCRQICI